MVQDGIILETTILLNRATKNALKAIGAHIYFLNLMIKVSVIIWPNVEEKTPI